MANQYIISSRIHTKKLNVRELDFVTQITSNVLKFHSMTLNVRETGFNFLNCQRFWPYFDLVKSYNV